MNLAVLASFVSGLVLILVLTPQLIRFSHRHGLYDRMDERKMHERATSRLGGAGMFVALMAATVIGLLVDGGYSPRKAMLIGSGFLPIFAVSLWDDLRSLPWWVRLLVQAAGATTLALVVRPLVKLNLPFIGAVTPGPWSYPIVVCWLLLTTNAMNLIDGLDGLAAGVAAIAGTVLAVSALRLHVIAPAILAAALVGVCLGFIRYNFHPAKIFMGDSGATLLGFALGAVSLTGPGKNVAFISLIVPILAMAVPLVDVVGAIARRSRRGTNVFKADQEHIHHFLLSLGLGHQRTVLLLYLVTALLGTVALFLASGPRSAGLFIFLLAGAGALLLRRRRV